MVSVGSILGSMAQSFEPYSLPCSSFHRQVTALTVPNHWYSLGVDAHAGVTVRAGDWVYADGDGVLVSPEPLA